MPENSNTPNNKNGKDPKRKVIRVRINFSWFYFILILAIGWMLFSNNGPAPEKIEWAEVQSIVRSGDVKDIHFVRNDFKGTVTIKPERLAKYASKFPGDIVPTKSPHFTFLVSSKFDAEKEFADLNATLPENDQVKIIMNSGRRFMDIDQKGGGAGPVIALTDGPFNVLKAQLSTDGKVDPNVRYVMHLAKPTKAMSETTAVDNQGAATLTP